MKSSLGITLMELVNYTQSLEIDPVKVKLTILMHGYLQATIILE